MAGAGELIDIRCPYCGNELRIVTRSVGSYSMREDIPESIECTAWVPGSNGGKPSACKAEWEPDGTARTEPEFVLYPDSYDKPTAAAPVIKSKAGND